MNFLRRRVLQLELLNTKKDKIIETLENKNKKLQNHIELKSSINTANKRQIANLSQKICEIENDLVKKDYIFEVNKVIDKLTKEELNNKSDFEENYVILQNIIRISEFL